MEPRKFLHRLGPGSKLRWSQLFPPMALLLQLWLVFSGGLS